MRLIDADYLDNKMFRNCPIEEGGIPLPDFATHTKILKLYPTVDAVPVVHGRWEWLGCDEFVCSVCGGYVEYQSHNCGYAYCPKCGAKMDGICSHGEPKNNTTK